MKTKRYSKLLRILGSVGILAIALLPALPAVADTSLPSSTPSVLSFNMYRNIIEPGDMVLLIYANIPYTSIPTNPVTETFIWRMLSTNGTTEYGSTVGCAFKNKGYGYNLYSMYWNADNVSALLSWGIPYIIKLSGNPAAFDTPPEYNFQLSTADYTTANVSEDVKAEMGARIMTIADDLNQKWALSSSLYLTSEVETGTVLSLQGEAFFRGAILGIQGMVPEVFSYVVKDIDATPRTWEENYSSNLTTQWQGTWVDTAKSAGGTFFGTSFDLTSFVILGGLALGALIATIIIAGDAWSGLIDSCIVIILGARLGMFGLGYLALIVALCWLFVSFKLKRVFQ